MSRPSALVLFVIAPAMFLVVDSGKRTANVVRQAAPDPLEARIEEAVAIATWSLEARIEELEVAVEHLRSWEGLRISSRLRETYDDEADDEASFAPSIRQPLS